MVVKLTEKVLASLKLKKEVIRKKAQTDGLMVYITDHTEMDDDKLYFKMSAYEIVKHYQDKFVVENAFRELKSFLELRPMFVRSEEHIKGHFDITVMSYFINNYIYRKLAVSRRSLGKYLQTLMKKYCSDVSKIQKYSKEHNINLNQLFDKKRIKSLLISSEKNLKFSDSFYEKVLEYTEGISLSEFYDNLLSYGSVAKLASPKGIEIYKQQKLGGQLKEILKKIDLQTLSLPQSHKALRIY